MRYGFVKLRMDQSKNRIYTSRKMKGLIRKITYIIIFNVDKIYRSDRNKMSKNAFGKIVKYSKKICIKGITKFTNLIGILKQLEFKNVYQIIQQTNRIKVNTIG